MHLYGFCEAVIERKTFFLIHLYLFTVKEIYCTVSENGLGLTLDDGRFFGKEFPLLITKLEKWANQEFSE
jgi:hypothetical protein